MIGLGFRLLAQLRMLQNQMQDVLRTDSKDMKLSSSCDEQREEFDCPIGKAQMREPVFTSDGHTYERKNIIKWLERNNTSPNTGQMLPDKVLRPNWHLRSQIVAHRMKLGMEPLPSWDPEDQETIRNPPQPVPEELPMGAGMQATMGVQIESQAVGMPPQVQQRQLDPQTTLQTIAEILLSEPSLMNEIVQAEPSRFTPLRGRSPPPAAALAMAQALMSQPGPALMLLQAHMTRSPAARTILERAASGMHAATPVNPGAAEMGTPPQFWEAAVQENVEALEIFLAQDPSRATVVGPN